MVQGGQAEPGGHGDAPALLLGPGAVQLSLQVLQKQAPEGILLRPGPQVLCQPGLVPQLQGIELVRQGFLQGFQGNAPLPGLTGEEDE